MEINTTDAPDDLPSFGLSLENELLMLKLKAEFGAVCTTGHQDIPPLVVNEFLKSVYEFEQKFRGPLRRITIHEKLGKPVFPPAETLNDKQLTRELKRLMQALHTSKLELDVLGKYEDRVIYRFITQEFFDHEMQEMDLAGYIHHFCYEDFHPNHEMDITRRSVEFLTGWFGQTINEYSWHLGEQFIHPDTRTFTKEDIAKRIRNVFDAYTCFSDCAYRIGSIDVSWSEEMQQGDAHVKGWVKYDAFTEGKEQLRFEGPFELYMNGTEVWWTIYYFVLPGFSWNE